ncbi:alpha/beta hydrolase [Nocardiopsis tropica]|uniref:alpha/beta fold hydrolase n=1 Tax=Tsukamurella strandjordii TaxID=147577 RepID=UPI0031D2D8CD
MPTIDLTAGRVHYVESGEGPPVVFLHGLLMNHIVWDGVIDLLPPHYRCIRPTLPLGGHTEPLKVDADLSMHGLNVLIAEFLEALELDDVTVVHSDWGGGLFLTAYGLDQRVGAIVALPCEAFDNFPPGLPGVAARAAAYLPGGVWFALWQMRIRWLSRLPMSFGWMTTASLDDAMVRGWTEPGLNDSRVRRDLLKYLRSGFDKRVLIENTEALKRFPGEALVLWSAAGKVMPRDHGVRLIRLIPRSTLVEIDDAYVLAQIDQPARIAAELSRFLAGRHAAGRRNE